MLAIPELAMPKSQKVITVYNGRREVWPDYEEAKSYFLEMIMKETPYDRNLIDIFVLIYIFYS